MTSHYFGTFTFYRSRHHQNPYIAGVYSQSDVVKHFVMIGINNEPALQGQ
jgi:hypothetical protein